MASPGELTTVIAEVTQKPRPTVFAIDRELVGAGLRKVGGRGTSAAKMTPRDAAQLLTAVMGSDQIRDAVSVVKFFSDTRLNVMPGVAQPHPYASVPIPELSGLPFEHSFIDALAAVIAAVASGSVAALPIMTKSPTKTPMAYSIFVTYPSRTCGIGIWGEGWECSRGGGIGAIGDVQYALPWPEDEGDGRKKFFAAMHRKYPTSKQGSLRATWTLGGSIGWMSDPIGTIGELFKA